jgi:hypothetical protein
MSKQRGTATTLVSQRTYAKARGVSSTWISKLVREGRIPTTAGRIHPARADAALAADASAGDHVTLSEAERRWRLAIARLKELELQLRTGKVCLIADVERMQVQVNGNIKQRLLALPAKLTPRLVGVANQAVIKTILEREIHETLLELVTAAVPD